MAFGADKPAACELASKSIISRSSSGLAQVSNLGNVEIKCRVPARPFPARPGESRGGLKVTTAAYQISPDGSKKPAPSEVHQTAGGFDPNSGPEWVKFYVHIPLKPAERDAEARRFLAKLDKATNQSKPAERLDQRQLEKVREVVYQQRVGHFRVECRVLDDDRMMGVCVVEFEVLFKGRFSDAGLPGGPPA